MCCKAECRNAGRKGVQHVVVPHGEKAMQARLMKDAGWTHEAVGQDNSRRAHLVDTLDLVLLFHDRPRGPAARGGSPTPFTSF